MKNAKYLLTNISACDIFDISEVDISVAEVLPWQTEFVSRIMSTRSA